MTELLSCPFCGGEAGFHKDEDCNGCHYIWCHSCDGMFDLSAKADPENDTETLEELNERIAPIWNNRAQQSAPAGYVLVPVEPTHEMLEALWGRSFDQFDEGGAKKIARIKYQGLLAAAPKAECTNSDSWNCKYCNKTKDCEALKDPRNFAAPKAEQPPVQEPLDQYDAGLLNDFGGGNVEWWQDYIRAELGRAHDFYQSQVAAAPQPVSDDARDALVVALDALIADYDGEIHNEYDGTSMLDSRLSEINYAREALAAYRAAQEKK